MGAGKTDRLNIRLTPEEHASINQRASRAQMPVAEYMRRCCLSDGNRPRIEVDVELLRSLYRLVRNAAGNLNQAVVMARRYPTLADSGKVLAEAAAQVAKASEAIATFLTDARNSL